MKDGNSKLLLGLGLGAVVGVAAGYLLTAANRKRLEEDLQNVGNGIKDGVKSTFAKMKSKVEEAGAEAADKASDWSESTGEKTREWGKQTAEKMTQAADDLNAKAQEDHAAHERYAKKFREDINNLKEKDKGENNPEQDGK